MRWTALLVMFVVCCGCGGSSPPTAEPPPRAAPPPVPPRPAAQVRPKVAKPSPVPTTDRIEFTTRDWSVDPGFANFEIATPAENADRTAYYAIGPGDDVSSATLDAFVPDQGIRKSKASRKLPAGFEALSATASDEGWPLRIRCQADGMELVFVAALVTRVGSNLGPVEAQPEHAAAVSAFYIDCHEVTLGQYLNYRERVRVEQKTFLAAPSNATDDVQHPVLGISWRDADAYARQMQRQLPTEVEWEAAGRGEPGYLYPWGNGRELWERPRVPGQIDAVESFRADLSVFGARDLAGNAREWCADWYRADAFQEALEADGSPRHDWAGPSRSDPVGHRVIKGSQTNWELWARGHGTLAQGVPDVGFRCVLRLPE